MPYAVDSNTVSTVGLESSPVAAAFSGLRATTLKSVDLARDKRTSTTE
jgi:hypothetical protein